MIVPLAHSDAGSEGHSDRPLKISILGSTGSIGQQALQVVRDNPGYFEVVSLAAGRNVGLLSEQIREFKPSRAVIGAAAYRELKERVSSSCEIFSGEDILGDPSFFRDVDVVLAAIVGAAGLRSVVAALKVGKRVALANKESLVAAGELVSSLLSFGGSIVPVDSEHSALFQSLLGHKIEDVDHLIITASGGPFRLRAKEEFGTITPEQAVKHPKWNMGAKISIDSATLMNKALELIEAHWLFGVEEKRISVVVHPQSIVHSLVSFVDGTQVAELSVPDMKGPIAFALMWPNRRLPKVMAQLNLATASPLEFYELDCDKFPAVNLARAALNYGGAACAVFNMANEVAVSAFLERKITFDRIVPVVTETLEEGASMKYKSLEELLEVHAQVVEIALRKL